MRRIGDAPLKTSLAAQKQVAELGFALLGLQAATPAGEWVDEHFPGEYRAVLERARSLAGDEAFEGLLRALLVHAQVLLAYLVGVTGVSENEWLDRIRSDFGGMPSGGTGVRGAHDLRLR